jgi:hypothetical protein
MWTGAGWSDSDHKYSDFSHEFGPEDFSREFSHEFTGNKGDGNVVTAQLEAVAAKPMKVVEKKPVLDLFGGMCDPKECGEWDCKRFCFCFKMFPWYDTLFDRRGWSEEYCPSDEDTCDCTPVEVQAWDVPQKLDELKRDPFFPFDKLGPIWNPQMMFWDVIQPRIICGDWVPGPGDLHDMINEIQQAQGRDGADEKWAFQLQAMENMLTHIMDKPDAKITVDNIAAMFKEALRPSQRIELNDMMSCSNAKKYANTDGKRIDLHGNSATNVAPASQFAKGNSKMSAYLNTLAFTPLSPHGSTANSAPPSSNAAPLRLNDISLGMSTEKNFS